MVYISVWRPVKVIEKILKYGLHFGLATSESDREDPQICFTFRF